MYAAPYVKHSYVEAPLVDASGCPGYYPTKDQDPVSDQLGRQRTVVGTWQNVEFEILNEYGEALGNIVAGEMRVVAPLEGGTAAAKQG